MNIEELLNEQRELDKTLEVLKKLILSHNEYLDYKKENADGNFKNDKKVKKLAKIQNICNGYVLVWAILFGFLAVARLELINSLLVILSTGGLAIVSQLVVGLSSKMEKNRIKFLKNAKYARKVEDDILYEALCEKRSLYHKMNKEHECRVNQLSSSEYQEYLELVNEYLQVLDNIKEESVETKDKEVTVLETQKKRRLRDNFMVNKSKVQ